MRVEEWDGSEGVGSGSGGRRVGARRDRHNDSTLCLLAKEGGWTYRLVKVVAQCLEVVADCGESEEEERGGGRWACQVHVLSAQPSSRHTRAHPRSVFCLLLRAAARALPCILGLEHLRCPDKQAHTRARATHTHRHAESTQTHAGRKLGPLRLVLFSTNSTTHRRWHTQALSLGEHARARRHAITRLVKHQSHTHRPTTAVHCTASPPCHAASAPPPTPPPPHTHTHATHIHTRTLS